MRRKLHATRAVTALILAVGLTSCQKEEPVESGAWPPPSAVNLLAAPSTLGIYQVSAEIPATPAGDVLRWALDGLNVFPERLDAAGLSERFASSVLDTVSAPDLAASMAVLARQRPYAFVGFNAPPEPNRIVAVVGSTSDGYRQLTVETDATGRATAFLFEALVPPSVAPIAPANPTGAQVAVAPPVEGSAAPVDGSAAPADGSAAPADGSAAPAAEGSAAPAAE